MKRKESKTFMNAVGTGWHKFGFWHCLIDGISYIHQNDAQVVGLEVHPI